MKKIVLVLVMLVLVSMAPNTLKAAVLEDFEDGDVTNNPTWVLKHQDPEVGEGMVTSDPVRSGNLVYKGYGTLTGHRVLKTTLDPQLSWDGFSLSIEFLATQGYFSIAYGLENDDYVMGVGVWYDNRSPGHTDYVVIGIHETGYSPDSWMLIPKSQFHYNEWYKVDCWYDYDSGLIRTELSLLDTGEIIGQADRMPTVDYSLEPGITLARFGIEELNWQYVDNICLASVPEPTTPPVADAGPDQTVTDTDDNGSEAVTLDGSGSYDSDGAIVNWVWTDNLGDTIPDGEVTIAMLSVGTHTITLTVTDDDGLTATDTVIIRVNPPVSVQPGSIVAWGDGDCNVPAGNDFVDIAAGHGHGLAIKSDGSLVAWCGADSNVPAGNDFVAVATNGATSLALKSGGSLVAWGNNDSGQCDVPTGNDFVAIAVGGYFSVALKGDGSLVAWGSEGPQHYPVLDVPPGNDFVDVAASSFFGVAIREDGSLAAWGSSAYDRLDVPASNDFVVVALGYGHGLGLKSDGSLASWGRNWEGAGDVPAGNDFVLVGAGYDHSLALRSDGSVVAWGRNDYGQCNVPAGNEFVAIAARGRYSLGLVVEPPTPPVADADGPYTIFVGDWLTLDANDSTDDDNDIVSYMWDLDDDGSFETDAGSQAVFDVNYDELQLLGLLINHTYTIHLKVTDSEQQSDTADSTLTIIPKPALSVALDIKPGSCPNPVNVKSKGVLPIAVLGTDDLDVTTIDPTSVRLAGVEPLRSGYEDVAGPFDSNDCNCVEAGPDGLLDLTLKFETQGIVKAIGDVNDGDVLTLELTGVLYDPIPFERPIEGTDCILIKGKYKAHNKADINKDGVVDFRDFAIFAENWLQSSIVED